MPFVRRLQHVDGGSHTLLVARGAKKEELAAEAAKYLQV